MNLQHIPALVAFGGALVTATYALATTLRQHGGRVREVLRQIF